MINLFNWLADEATKPQQTNWPMWIFIGVIVIFFLVKGFFDNKKRKAEADVEQKRKDAMCAGTTIITIGGIVGEVVSVSEDNYVLKTGESVIELDKRSIYQMTLPADVQSRIDAEILAEQEAAKNKKGKKASETEEVAVEETAKDEVTDEKAE